jgi:hypothetical protein
VFTRDNLIPLRCLRGFGWMFWRCSILVSFSSYVRYMKLTTQVGRRIPTRQSRLHIGSIIEMKILIFVPVRLRRANMLCIAGVELLYSFVRWCLSISPLLFWNA